MDQSLINRIVEAALLASSQPLTPAQLRELFPEEQPAPAGAIEAALEQLQADSAERGVELVEVASGFRYQVRADVHPWVARLWTERQTRYTRATLETLALIAYRQPITRGEIEQVRGVTVSSNIIKALEEREWIRVVGHRDVPGRPALFGTTKTFLDYFGLKRLDELPPLSELKDIGELEPQLQFDQATGVDARIAAGGLGEGAAAGESAADGGGVAEDHAPGVEGAVDDTQEDAADHAEVDAPGTGAAADAQPDGGTPGQDAFEGHDDADADADEDEHADDDAEGELDFRSERPVVFEDDGADIENEHDSNEHDSDAAEGDVDPEAAPGTRAANENETAPEPASDADAITAWTGEDDASDPHADAVETTTVPALTTASDDAAESERND